ncbi:hypothetical protein J7T55_005342 [Diaporthe amygdali]|uniref:uncharacterized protein n=1 Tax=Phomopsis amygdali TaxID=1214568 RepID=UPI0022FE5696|nr:uncharacterized protein J7T55_005342 [Diaporthe amygdali]KAJ0108365.1 hypothetical protein J7T55_005342 [Diaporthe amygdali]
MCFTNGLCKANTVDQYNWNWRVGCTDSTFSDPACPNYCKGIGSDDGAHLIFQCSDDETWCCATGNVDNFVRNYNFTCCSKADLTFYNNSYIVIGSDNFHRATSFLFDNRYRQLHSPVYRGLAKFYRYTTRLILFIKDPGYRDGFGTRHNEGLLNVLDADDRGHEVEMAHQRSPVELEGKRMSRLYE